ncbi:hypothetical protein EZ449_15570 [Pedobacter frigidisoli]|uniref:Uncharacterized protein n=1 Tax=Pedobacter frigidisoli TaxID=2530455 RepID=A0A4R0NZL2_9SPHI|nr:hypothetical protein [Pedobacter frigidisoli]TCD05879.1 hypothetical protein EZ449_15570 [Pedobacter frigidisoli]
MGRIEKENIKKAVTSPSDPIGLGNIFDVFSRLEDIAGLLSEFLPQMERLIKLMQNTTQISTPKATSLDSNLQEKVTELLSIAKQTHESSNFVRMVFTQEKPKKTKKKEDKSEAVNEYLRKYNRSMKL